MKTPTSASPATIGPITLTDEKPPVLPISASPYVINGMPVEAAIAPLGGRNYAFAMGAAGVPNLPAANPVMVTLTIGNNSGTATVTANIQ